jgi:hypothetical protein
MDQFFAKKQPAQFPSWEAHISVLDKSKRANWLLKCKMCAHEFRGSGARAVVHLSGEGKGVRACTQIPDSLKRQFQEMNSGSLAKESERLSKLQTTLLSHGQKLVAGDATKELGLFAFTSGVPFNVFQNPHFLNYSRLLNQLYTVPSPYTLANPTLDEADAEINESKEALLQKSFICLTSDAYTNVAMVNLINFEALTKYGSVHVDTVQRTSMNMVKDAEYIASLVIEVVAKLGGVERVVGFVSDNENTMKSVWRILEERLDHFLTAPCVVHVTNLLLKDIGKLNWLEAVINQTKRLVIFF